MGEKLDVNHVIDDMVVMLHFTIYWWGISACGFNNGLMIKA